MGMIAYACNCTCLQLHMPDTTDDTSRKNASMSKAVICNSGQVHQLKRSCWCCLHMKHNRVYHLVLCTVSWDYCDMLSKSCVKGDRFTTAFVLQHKPRLLLHCCLWRHPIGAMPFYQTYLS